MGTPKKPVFLTDGEALNLGRSIRDNLVSACELIASRTLASAADYEKLDEDLRAVMGQSASHSWVHKYYHMIFPEKFVGWYAQSMLRHNLYGLGIRPSEKGLGMHGQLALIKRKTGLLSPQFGDICQAMFGDVRRFCRIESAVGGNHCAGEWKRDGLVAAGWPGIGDLNGFVRDGSFNRDKLERAVSSLGIQPRTAVLDRTGEIKRFYDTSASTVFVIMDGGRLAGLMDGVREYRYEAQEPLPHRKSGTWHTPAWGADTLPVPEGLQSVCSDLRDPENLLFLYREYYRTLEAEKLPPAEKKKESGEIRFHTGYQSSFERNRIFFGAPGTGKSYTVNEEAKLLLGENSETDCERVTFHPDYSYAGFVGTYKPVPFRDSSGREAITYAFVPGPFTRVYVNALKNSRTSEIRPFLLIIEEINRANAAAVFGDIFQLLDRGEDNVSEYPVQASEDLRRYLAKELGCAPSECAKLRIPDNMFLWATMNSADQGVSALDTAFKRRWDFTYLGIDDSEAGIAGRTVVLGQDEYRRVVEWNTLRKAINEELLKYRINEDKMLGPYFLSKRGLLSHETMDSAEFTRVFKNKVLMYLFEDAARQKRLSLFSGCPEEARGQYSRICREFDVRGVYIFCPSISGRFDDAPRG